MTIKDRLMAKMKRDGDCWIWTGANTGGKFKYGRMRLGVDQIESTHVLSYEEFIGPVSKGLCVLHKCDKPPCLNPKHLFLGTKKENAADMFSKARENPRRGSKNGNAKLTDAQIEEIKRLAASGKTHTSIAPMFGVSQVQISNVVAGRQRKARA